MNTAIQQGPVSDFCPFPTVNELHGGRYCCREKLTTGDCSETEGNQLTKDCCADEKLTACHAKKCIDRPGERKLECVFNFQ